MAVSLSALGGAGQQFFDDNGNPLSGGKLYSYAAGTTTPLATYTSNTGLTPLPNPIILNAAGRVPTGEIWVLDGSTYKFALYKSDNTLIATWDNIGGVNAVTLDASDVSYTFPYANAVTTTVAAKLDDVVNATDFGVVPDGVTDNSTAMSRFWSAVNNTTKIGVLPAGVIRCASPVIWDIPLNSRAGVTIRGPALGACIIDVRSAPATADGNTQFLLSCTSGPAFYSEFNGFTILGNHASGPSIRIGRAGPVDEFNGFVFEQMEFKNVANNANAIGVEFNGLYNCDVRGVTTNTGGARANGISTRITRAAFCRFFGSFSGAGIGLKVDGTFSFSNTFEAMDFEECDIAVQFAGSSNNRNTFVGGTFVGNTCIDFQVGSGAENLLIAPNLAPYLGGAIAAGTTGVAVLHNSAAPINPIICGGLYIPRPDGRDSDLTIDVASPYEARTLYLRGNQLRWNVRMDNATESGGNAGSDYAIARYSDAGAFIDNPFYIERATGWTVATSKLLGVGFFGAGPVTSRPVVTGAKGGNAALTSLLSALNSLGLITDNTT